MTSKQTTRLGKTPEEGIKAPVVVASIANLALTGLPIISGVQLVEGDRVLIKDQTNLTQNGIYCAFVGNWDRASDWNKSNDVVNGQLVLDSNSGQLYRASFSGDFSINVTEVNFYIVQSFNSKDDVTLSAALIDNAYQIGDVVHIKSIDGNANETTMIFDVVASKTQDIANGIYTGVSHSFVMRNRNVVKGKTLSEILNRKDYKVGDVVEYKERTSGNGGGITADVVLASSVSINIYQNIQCVGVPTLAIVLRIVYPFDVLALGALGDGATDDTGVFNYLSNNFSGGFAPKRTYKLNGTWSLSSDFKLVGEKGTRLLANLTAESGGFFPNQMVFGSDVSNIEFENITFDFGRDQETYIIAPGLTSNPGFKFIDCQDIKFSGCFVTSFVTNGDDNIDRHTKEWLNFGVMFFDNCDVIIFDDFKMRNINEETINMYECGGISIRDWDCYSNAGDGTGGTSSWGGFWYCDGLTIINGNMTLTGGSVFNCYSRNVLIENVRLNEKLLTNDGRGFDFSNEFDAREYDVYNVTINNCYVKCTRYGIFGVGSTNSGGTKGFSITNNTIDVTEEDNLLVGIRIDEPSVVLIENNNIILGDASKATIGQAVRLSLATSSNDVDAQTSITIRDNEMRSLTGVGMVVNVDTSLSGLNIKDNKWTSQDKEALSSSSGASVFCFIRNTAGAVASFDLNGINIEHNELRNVGGGLFVATIDDLSSFNLNLISIIRNSFYGDTNNADRFIRIENGNSGNEGVVNIERNYFENSHTLFVDRMTDIYIVGNKWKWTNTPNNVRTIVLDECSGLVEITDNRIVGNAPGFSDADDINPGTYHIVNVVRNATFRNGGSPLIWNDTFTNTPLPN